MKTLRQKPTFGPLAPRVDVTLVADDDDVLGSALDGGDVHRQQGLDQLGRRQRLPVAVAQATCQCVNNTEKLG